ncbi:MAG: hypothetical protein WCF36_20660 [Candidatus Nanopelagicales bacterium]
MRAYLPVGWADLRTLRDAGELAGPRRGCVVDPVWRAGGPEVDEEEWEFEAQLLAAQALPDLDGGVVLARDLDPKGLSAPVDGWLDVPGLVRRREVGALLTEDLAWFGVQELDEVLDRR